MSKWFSLYKNELYLLVFRLSKAISGYEGTWFSLHKSQLYLVLYIVYKLK